MACFERVLDRRAWWSNTEVEFFLEEATGGADMNILVYRKPTKI